MLASLAFAGIAVLPAGSHAATTGNLASELSALRKSFAIIERASESNFTGLAKLKIANLQPQPLLVYANPADRPLTIELSDQPESMRFSVLKPYTTALQLPVARLRGDGRCYVWISSLPAGNKLSCTVYAAPYMTIRYDRVLEQVQGWRSAMIMTMPSDVASLDPKSTTCMNAAPPSSDGEALCLLARQKSGGTFEARLVISHVGGYHSVQIIFSGMHRNALNPNPLVEYTGLPGGELGTVILDPLIGPEVQLSCQLAPPGNLAACQGLHAPTVLRAFVAEHERGHYVLGHLTLLQEMRKSGRPTHADLLLRRKMESAADAFALHSLISAGDYRIRDLQQLADFLRTHAVKLEDHPSPDQRRADLIAEIDRFTHALPTGDASATTALRLLASSFNPPFIDQENNVDESIQDYPLWFAVEAANEGYYPILCSIRAQIVFTDAQRVQHLVDRTDIPVRLAPGQDVTLTQVLHENQPANANAYLELPFGTTNPLKSCRYVAPQFADIVNGAHATVTDDHLLRSNQPAGAVGSHPLFFGKPLYANDSLAIFAPQYWAQINGRPCRLIIQRSPYPVMYGVYACELWSGPNARAALRTAQQYRDYLNRDLPVGERLVFERRYPNVVEYIDDLDSNEPIAVRVNGFQTGYYHVWLLECSEDSCGPWEAAFPEYSASAWALRRIRQSP